MGDAIMLVATVIWAVILYFWGLSHI